MSRTPDPTHGFVRSVSRSLAACELLHLARQKFDLARARQQHAAYVRALEDAGVHVTVLPEEPDLPDAVFVEDTAVMLDELAVLGRLGLASRAREGELIASEIERVRKLFFIQAPAKLEGGDVLRVGKTLFVGRSTRTNQTGIDQLREIMAPFGYSVIAVGVTGCLHLKTGATAPAPGLILVNPAWIDVAAFRGREVLSVPETEPWGANVLPVNDQVLVAASSPGMAEILKARGLNVRSLEISELQKAEAGLTCLSLLYSERSEPPGPRC